MKTELIRARLTFILVIVLSLTLWGYSQKTPSQSTGPAEVAEGVYFVGDFGCNIGASIGPDGVLLIDSGLKNRCDDKTVVMPGHGPISNRKGLQSFRNMLAVTKDRVAGLIKEGKTLEEVIAADVTAGLFRGGKSWLDPNLFVYFVYTDLSKKQKGSVM